MDKDEDKKTREDKILSEARERLRLAIDADAENRQSAIDDLKFIDGEQWPEQILNERISSGRPCITINKMPTFIDQVVGDQRQNRPDIKVVPVDSKGDVRIARILGGWIKHVMQVSQADIVIDHAFEHAVACGYGAFRVTTKYTEDFSFNQEAYVGKIDNALAVYWGRHSKYDASDAPYCFIISDIDREEYKQKYGDDPMPFNQADSQFIDGWAREDTVRIAEYFIKEAINKEIYLLEDGRIVDELNLGDLPIKQKTIKSYKVKWYLLSGNKILDEKEWVGRKYIPVVPVWGKQLNIGGKLKTRGLIRYAKDPQRMYNYWQSSDTEIIALAPKTPYLVTPEQISGHESQWGEAHRRNYPYLLVNPDPRAPGWPKREPPPQASSAMVTKIQMADQEIRDTAGLQKAALGMQSNERSGAAIRERKMEGDTGTFSFVDNLSRSIEQLGRILLDMAPGILDTERIIRLGLNDGGSEFEHINIENESGDIMNDISIGTYDVVVRTGPSYATQRTEARISMAEFIQYDPASASLIGDLYARAMDWPGAEEVASRLEFRLPPELREEIKKKREREDGIEPEKPIIPAGNLAPPDPLIAIKMEEEVMRLEELKIKIEQEKTKLESMQLENQLKLSNTKEGMKKLIEEIIREKQ